MQVKTTANVISYFDNSYVRSDGQPVKFYKIQVANPGEPALELPLEEECYNGLVAKKMGYTENVPLTFEVRMFGNKVSLRCVKVG